MAEYARSVRPFFQNVKSLQVSGETTTTSSTDDNDQDGDLNNDNNKTMMDMLKKCCSWLAANNNGCMHAVVLDDTDHGGTFPETLHLTDLDFNNAYNTFKVRSRAIMSHLVELKISGCCSRTTTPCHSGFCGGDRGLLLLDGTLSNLRELHLSSMTIGNETFDMLGRHFPNLTKLEVSSCRTTDQRLTTVDIGRNNRLEELVVRDVVLTDADFFRYIVPSLGSLKVLKILYCNVGRGTLAAICTHLPDLVELELCPSEQITDEGLVDDLGPKPLMRRLALDNTDVTDVGLIKVTASMPALEKIRVGAANVGDDALVALGPNLSSLDLRGTHVTDFGLESLVARLPHLEELSIDSGSITEAGLRKVVPLLAPSVRHLAIDICEASRRVFFDCQDDQEQQLTVTLTDEELVQMVVRRFRDVGSLTVSCENLSATVLRDDLVSSQSRLTTLMLTGGGGSGGGGQPQLDDEALHVVASQFPRLHKLHLYATVATDSGICDVATSLGGGSSSLTDLVIENKAFVSDDAAVELVKKLKSVQTWDIFANREQSYDQMAVTTITSSSDDDDVSSAAGVDIRLNGSKVGDTVLEALVRHHHDTIDRLQLRDTAVTDECLASVVPHLTRLSVLVITSDQIGDNALHCISTRLPAKLKELTLKSLKVTDQGLVHLCDAARLLEGLEVFEVYECNITDMGIRNVAPKLKSVRQLHVCDNANVNEGIRHHLHQLFPHLGLVEPEQVDNEEEEEEDTNDDEFCLQ